MTHPARSAVHVAANVYLWSAASRRRLLVDCLGPLARDLRDRGLVRRFLYAGFDARGPHLFALFSTTPDRRTWVESRLSAGLDAFLALHPDIEALPAAELAARHDQCRGKQLCAVDAEPGLEQNNSYRLCLQPADGYPFRAGGEDELWDLCGEMALWAVDQLRRGGEAAAAVRWTAALDGALARTGASAPDFFRYHATTVLLPLASALAEDEEKVVGGLAAAVGAKNRAAFAREWEAVEREAPWAGVERLVTLAVSHDGATPGERWKLLREVNHCVLSQLQQPERARLALWLYAWMRGVPEAADACR